MTTNQSGTLHSTNGLGFGSGSRRSSGTARTAWIRLAHSDGAVHTEPPYQVDPKTRMVIVLMLQMMPNTTDIQTKFSTLVYQALVN